MLARRAHVEVIYNGIDITGEIHNDLLSFSYTDNASGTADDVSIVLKDETKKYMNHWAFEQGDTVKATIITTNWRKDGEVKKLPCGHFTVDEPEYSGRPSVVNLKANSVPANSNFLHTKRTKVWNNATLKSIGQEVANRYGLKFYFDSSTNPQFKKKEQSEEPDSSFLQTLAEDSSFGFKVTDEKLILFNELEYEKKDAVATFYESNSSVLSYSFKPTLTDTGYKAVELKYYEPLKKNLISYMFATGEIDEKKDKIYKIKKSVNSLEEAKLLAQSTLRKLNKKQVTATLEIIGNTSILAATCIELKDFGKFSGKYYIDKASHGISGYKTSLELHRVLEGY